jgi:ERF superfamily
MYQSENINELAMALSKMQLELGAIPKNRVVKITTKTGRVIEFAYADLPGILNAIKKPLGDNGLFVTQDFQRDGDKYFVVTITMHSSGQWKKSELPINPYMQDLKDFGSQLTYLKRYALTSTLGIGADDDNEDTLEGGLADSHKEQEKKNGFSAPKPSEKVIARGQAFELETMLAECEPKFQQNIRDYLNKLGITMAGVAVENYANLRQSIDANLKKQRSLATV